MASISISSNDRWLSHPDTFWEDHVQQVAKYAVTFAQSLPESASHPLPFDIFVDLCRRIALFHDLGKTTSFFQNYIRQENPVKTEKTQHALLSAVVAYWEIENWLKTSGFVNPPPEIMAFLAFLVIRYHHGDLHSPNRSYAIRLQSELLQEQWRNIERKQLQKFWDASKLSLPLEVIDQRISSLPKSFKPQRPIAHFFRKRNDLDFFFLTNTLYSILIDSDKSAVGIHTLPQMNTPIPDDVIDRFRNLKGWNEPNTAFDRLRFKAYQEAQKRITTSSDTRQRIFNLQIPTGFGKTLTAISAALKLLHARGLHRVIYSLPFTTIIDQNYEELKTVLEKTLPDEVDSTLLLKHHHLSDVFYETEEETYTTPEAELLIEGWHSQMIVTTFVQLFHTLLGYRNRTLRKYHRLANAVIILDEIQSIPYKYWQVLHQLLIQFAERFNSYFILVTATQPRIFPQEEQIALVSPQRYYQATNRIRLFLHRENTYTLDAFCEEVLEKSSEKSRVIVVLNTIRSAQEFFYKIQPEVEDAEFLSSHVVPKERLARIRRLNASERYFLVTTQIVEAGVNLDAEIVFRDWAPLDSINQVAGRCNRFQKNESGEVHVYRLVNEKGRLFASFIYDRSLLDVTAKTLSDPQYEETTFLELCNHYFDWIAKFTPPESTALLQSIANLRYTDDEHAIEHFRLIEQNYEKQDVFIELDDEAKQVWEAYGALKEIPDYWKRREEYLKIKYILQNYIISVGVRDLKENPPPVVNGMYYVSQNQLDEYYDLTTGYKRISETSIW
ncbi:MAG: CRISPR-associated helicase Cas3' [Calditrichaeota bacterium]|nr:CRISPR-associated helicase Cas3' [Calditrichota bacterium]